MKRRKAIVCIGASLGLAGCLSQLSTSPKKELLVGNPTDENLTARVQLAKRDSIVLDKTYDLPSGKSDSEATFTTVPDSIIVDWDGKSETISYSPPEGCKQVTGINLSLALKSPLMTSTDCRN